MPEGVFTIKLTEACRLVNERLAQHGISASYSRIWSIVAAGGVPAAKAGAQWLVREDDVPRLVELLAPRAPTRAARPLATSKG